MNMDLQAASIGIDLNEIDAFPDAEEADEPEEPIDYGMKAVQQSQMDQFASPPSKKIEEPNTPELIRVNSPNNLTLRKQTTLKNHEVETIIEKHEENLVSPMPLRAKISHVDQENSS